MDVMNLIESLFRWIHVVGVTARTARPPTRPPDPSAEGSGPQAEASGVREAPGTSSAWLRSAEPQAGGSPSTFCRLASRLARSPSTALRMQLALHVHG
jgi:hypothetical protein